MKVAAHWSDVKYCMCINVCVCVCVCVRLMRANISITVINVQVSLPKRPAASPDSLDRLIKLLLL